MFYLSSVNALSLFLQHREEMVYGQRWGSGDDEDQSQSGDDLIYPPYPFFTCPLFYRPPSSGEQWSKEKQGEVD